jgi:hypothetical protein
LFLIMFGRRYVDDIGECMSGEWMQANFDLLGRALPASSLGGTFCWLIGRMTTPTKPGVKDRMVGMMKQACGTLFDEPELVRKGKNQAAFGSRVIVNEAPIHGQRHFPGGAVFDHSPSHVHQPDPSTSVLGQLPLPAASHVSGAAHILGAAHLPEPAGPTPQVPTTSFAATKEHLNDSMPGSFLASPVVDSEVLSGSDPELDRKNSSRKWFS